MRSEAGAGRYQISKIATAENPKAWLRHASTLPTVTMAMQTTCREAAPYSQQRTQHGALAFSLLQRTPLGGCRRGGNPGSPAGADEQRCSRECHMFGLNVRLAVSKVRQYSAHEGELRSNQGRCPRTDT